MSIGNWADQTDIFQACVHFLPVYLACPTASLLDLLLFLFAEILFPDIFSFYHLILKKITNHNVQTCLVPPCTVWLLIFVCRALTSKAVQRETLPEAAWSSGRPASLGSRRLELPSSWPSLQETAIKWFCALLTLPAWLQDLFLEIFRDLHGLVFLLSSQSLSIISTESPWPRWSVTGLKHWGHKQRDALALETSRSCTTFPESS